MFWYRDDHGDKTVISFCDEQKYDNDENYKYDILYFVSAQNVKIVINVMNSLSDILWWYLRYIHRYDGKWINGVWGVILIAEMCM